MQNEQMIAVKNTDFLPTRDPAGRLFYYRGNLLRGIVAQYASLYQQLLTHPNIERLFSAGLVPTEVTPYYTNKYPLVLKHQEIKPVAFPFEWCGDMLKEATLFFLQFALIANELGYGFKDMHSYNILFDTMHKPYFIDICSIVPLSKRIHLDFDEFKRYFLNPLYGMCVGCFQKVRLLINLGGYKTGKCLGGIDDEEVLLWLDDNLRGHYLSCRKQEKLLSSQYQDLFRLYQEEVQALSIHMPASCWSTYYDVSDSYPTNMRFQSLTPQNPWQPKQHYLYRLLKETLYTTVLDLGCAAGWFSRLAASIGKKVVAIDNDESALLALYREAKRNNYSILPLYCDISKAIAFYPRKGIKCIGRFRSDIVLVLALVHHLVYTGKMNFKIIAKLLATLTNKTLVVEFIDRHDRSIQDFEKIRSVPWYTGENFQKALKLYFKNIQIIDSAGNFTRYLLVCTEKKRVNVRLDRLGFLKSSKLKLLFHEICGLVENHAE